MQTKFQLTNSCLISVVKWVIHKPGDERGLAHALLSQEDKLELPQRVAGPEVCWRRHFWPCYCFLAKRPYKIARVWSLKHWKNALLGADSEQIWALGEGGRTVGWGALLRGRIQGASGSWKTLLKLFVPLLRRFFFFLKSLTTSARSTAVERPPITGQFLSKAGFFRNSERFKTSL